MIGKAMSSDGFNIHNAMKKIELERSKIKFVNNAFFNLINLVNKVAKSSDCKISKHSSKIEGENIFNGTITASIKVTSKGEEKELNIPLKIINSSIKYPDISVIEKKLNSIPMVNEAAVKAEKLATAHIAELTARIAKQEQNIIESAKNRFIERSGKLVEQTSGGPSAVPNSTVAREITCPKADLPDTIEEGDEYSIAGRKYKVHSPLNTFGQPGQDWVLTLID